MYPAAVAAYVPPPTTMEPMAGRTEARWSTCAHVRASFAGGQRARVLRVPIMQRSMPVHAAEIQDELARILTSDTFAGATRSSQLLRYLVEQTLAGGAERLKEYTIATEGLGRSADFAPRTDTIVRAEASRLRSRLELYYASEG